MWFGCLQDGLMRFDEANSRFDFFRNAHTGSSTIPILNVGSIVGFKKMNCI
jgi:hypothetical protein